MKTQTPDTPKLELYTENLNAKMKENLAYNQVFGREKEIEQVWRILRQKNKNSPLLIGDAGVGKTAIVEGLARALMTKDKTVPDLLNQAIIRSLELSSLMGQEEGSLTSKIRGIVSELKKDKQKNILFIDEIHTIMGTGQSNHSALDVANILKPALARGEILLIGATTLDEYHDYIEQDKAMERRFVPMMINEPTPKESLSILKRCRSGFEQHFGLELKPSAIKSAVELSIRYLPEAYLPDKAFSLIDSACALASIQKKKSVTNQDVAAIIQEKKGIPVSSILKEEQISLLEMEKQLKKRVKGQDEAISEVMGALAAVKAGIQNQDRPLESFLFLGTTGVGKTELAKALAEGLFGNQEEMIRLDMSEYQLSGSSEKLIGTRKTKGFLTEAVKNHPYCVLLFDEIEKAEPKVLDLLLQVLDDGRLTDGRGRMISFKNTLIILTTNLGAELIKMNEELMGKELSEQDYQNFLTRIDNHLIRTPSSQSEGFRREFINRIGKKIIFNMLEPPVIKAIAIKNLEQMNDRLLKQKVMFEYDDALLNYLVYNGSDKSNGARPIERFIKRKVLEPIGTIILAHPNQTLIITAHIIGKAPNQMEAIDHRVIDFEIQSKR